MYFEWSYSNDCLVSQYSGEKMVFRLLALMLPLSVFCYITFRNYGQSENQYLLLNIEMLRGIYRGPPMVNRIHLPPHHGDRHNSNFTDTLLLVTSLHPLPPIFPSPFHLPYHKTTASTSRSRPRTRDSRISRITPSFL